MGDSERALTCHTHHSLPDLIRPLFQSKREEKWLNDINLCLEYFGDFNMICIGSLTFCFGLSCFDKADRAVVTKKTIILALRKQKQEDQEFNQGQPGLQEKDWWGWRGEGAEDRERKEEKAKKKGNMK